jgi:molecular chaperone DnaJ
VEVPTLKGTQSLDIPPGTNSGEVFRMRRGGAKHLRGSGWGDQIIQVIVKTPERLTRRQKELLKEFAELNAKEFEMEKRRKKGRLFLEREE